MTLNDDVWVIVPAFNEVQVIRGVLEGLQEHFPNVVTVDDGSTDGSTQEIIASGVRIVRHSVNLGAGAALQTGIAFALLDPQARFFVTFDADGQHRCSDAVGMVNALRDRAEDILVGSRFLGSAEGMPVSRRGLLLAARLFERLSSGIKLTDAHNGLRAFTRNFAGQIDLRFSDMAHASELVALIKTSGVAYAEYPVTIEYTEYSRAKGQRSINSINIASDIWLYQLLRGRRL